MVPKNRKCFAEFNHFGSGGQRFTLGSRVPWSIQQQLRVFHVCAALIQLYFLALFHTVYQLVKPVQVRQKSSSGKTQHWMVKTHRRRKTSFRPHGYGKAKRITGVNIFLPDGQLDNNYRPLIWGLNNKYDVPCKQLKVWIGTICVNMVAHVGSYVVQRQKGLN